MVSCPACLLGGFEQYVQSAFVHVNKKVADVTVFFSQLSQI